MRDETVECLLSGRTVDRLLKIRLSRNSGVALLVIVSILVAASFVGLTVRSNEKITPNDQFFKVSIGPSPVIDETKWRLLVNGMVDHPMNLTYAEIKSFPNITEALTLDCVSGLSGRAYWTGVKLSDIMNMTGVENAAMKVVFFCADGYSTSLTISEAKNPDVILAWGMNNVTLPIDHGFPMRLVVPGNFGYKWAKWITHVEFVDYDYRGYWESRGWADDASIKPLSDWRIHAMLFSVAVVLGGFSVLSGMRNSQSAKLARKIPAIFAKKYHRYVSAIYYLVLFVTFTFWALQTYDLRGAIFYTLHGRMALLTIVFSVVGIVSGIPMLSGSSRFRLVHWVSNVTAYVLLLITIILGVLRVLG